MHLTSKFEGFTLLYYVKQTYKTWNKVCKYNVLKSKFKKLFR